MLAARALYFQANRFGDDGGYGDAWVTVKLGPVPVSFPNAAGRVRAVRYHDLHHIITEYDTGARLRLQGLLGRLVPEPR